MTKQRILLLQGGQSAEREVSLKSGAAVHEALLELGHEVSVVDGFVGMQSFDGEQIDVVFNILHGADGEDGKLAAWLDLEGYVSTCCGFAGTSASWHKDQTKLIAAAAGLQTPKSQLLKQTEDLRLVGDGPWIVKPATEGSSVGLFKANNETELKQAVRAGFEVADELLVEDYIEGVECTVGIVGDVVMPVVSIVPASELYDYQAKYQSEATQYHCPANINESWQQRLQEDALAVYQALNLQGWCRVDFIVDDKGQPWFLEVNTTPGMTNNSLLPKAAAEHGWSFNELVAAIVNTASIKTETCHE